MENDKSGFLARLDLWQSLLTLLESHLHLGISVDDRRANELACALLKSESRFGFPGKDQVAWLAETIGRGQWSVAAIFIKNVLVAVQNNAYRTPGSANSAGRVRPLTKMDTELFFSESPSQQTSCTKYFEVLVVCNDPAFSAWLTNEYGVCDTSRDEFRYRFVFVHTLGEAEDALRKNYDILSCLVAEKKEFPFQASNGENLDQIRPSGLLTPLRKIRSDIAFCLVADQNDVKNLTPMFDRVFRHGQPYYDIHYFLLKTVANLFVTPFFDALRDYSSKPKISFHALPISRAASIQNSNWAVDFYDFYGAGVFDAETSSTQGGLDSLLDPKGPIKQACDKAAITFGALETYFITSGTSTANKVVLQANLEPGDIVLVGADCHKSIPAAIVMTGADVIYLETYPLAKYDLYGGVRLQNILDVLQQLDAANQLQRVKQITLTNCTFDGVVYNVEKFMLAILAIKSDIIFHWDEAWFAHGHFHYHYGSCSAMKAARTIEKKLQSVSYKEEYLAKLGCKDKMADPNKVVIRVYATQSTHKTLTAFRQAAMIHVYDRALIRERFVDSYRMHTTTSPSYQNIASLDVARRQMSLEGFGLTDRSLNLAQRLRYAITNVPTLSECFSVLGWRELIGEECYGVGNHEHAHSSCDEFFYDPTRVLLDVSATGMDGALFREVLMTRFGIQVNKTSTNTVLFIVNIGVTEQQIEYLIMVLNQIASNLKAQSTAERRPRLSKVMPSERCFSSKYISFSGEKHHALKLREAYYDAFKKGNTKFVSLKPDLIKEIVAGAQYYSAGFVTPYPPGYPVLLPGQTLTVAIVEYLMSLEIREIHGYVESKGIKVFVGQQAIGTNVKFIANLREVSCETN